ncbi:MAG: hypothetical protein A2885_13430 [Sphingopyxis sp. RIFCSPHIGHO2_01_FULL_65_24]|nr:MAG: hypothetical protein A2885_13430 [Sphingopyxis sp. RIFCSPHIGHO2_01_FULL_65_24]
MPPTLPGLDYYDQRYRQRKPANEPVSRIDPLEAEMRRERDRQTRIDLLTSSSPDTVGRASTMAREIGASPLQVEDNFADAARGRDVRRFMTMAERYPAIGKWATANPRGAAAASDDYDSLSTLGRAWRSTSETVTGLGPMLMSGVYSAAGQVEGAIGAAYDLSESLNVMDDITAGFADILNRQFGTNWRPDLTKAIADKASADARKKRLAALKASEDYWSPKSTSWLARDLLQGVKSVPVTIAALATRSPGGASAVVGTLTGGGEYQKARDQGADLGTALAYGARQGAVEAITERMPASKLLKDIAARSPVGKMIMRQLATEIPGEQVATFLQDFDEWVTLNPEKTVAEFIAERPEAIRQTLFATIGGVGATTAITTTTTKAVDAAAQFAVKREEARRAQQEGVIIDQAGAAAEASKLRERDPDAFAALMRELAEETGADQVYIPAEAIQEFMQLDSFDAGAWSQFEEASIEAIATGGDLVVPVDKVLTEMPGTAAWDALRDHMRLSPAGMSRSEAEAFNDDIADITAQLEEQASALDTFDREMLEGREALITDVTEKLMSAGYTPSVARTQAELVGKRYETRAARLGQKLTGAEFGGVSVTQILPEKLALSQKDTGLDRVIEAMRRNTKGESAGKSLLQFIAERGGVDDPGGDISSMGGDKWHRGKVGQRKLVKAVDKKQASFISAGPRDTSHELVLRAAINAGYFPELEGREATTYDDAIDNRVLLEAIGAELAGTSRYAKEVDTSTTDAAAELAALLSNEGLDPTKATRRQIRDAVAAYSERQAGRDYEQPGLRAEITAAWEGRQTRGFIDLGPMPQALVDYGLPSGALQLGRAKIGAIARKHNISVNDLVRLPAQLERPWAIYPSTLEGPGRFVVALQQRDQAGNPILVAIQPDGRITTVNSVYGKEGRAGLTGDQVVKQAIDNARAKGLAVFEGNAPPVGYSEPLTDMRPEKRSRPVLSLGGKSKDERSFDQSDATALEQEGAAEPRGRIIFPSGEFTGVATIELFKARNLSTFLHETGHLWLEELRADAASVDDGHQLAADWAAVEGWFAANGHPIGGSPARVETVDSQSLISAAQSDVAKAGSYLRERADAGLLGGASVELIIEGKVHRITGKGLKDDKGQAWGAFPILQPSPGDNARLVISYPAIEGGVIPVEAHEMWARGVEQYLMEGKAPVASLNSIFEQFRSWLVSIYRSVKALRSPLTPDIRKVMDRLIATDDDIALSSQEQALAPLLTDASGMTAAEYEAYVKLTGDARIEARAQLLDKTVRDIRARETKRYRNAARAAREEIAASVAERPAFRAIEAMRRTPIDRQWVVDNLGAETVVMLPRSVPPLFREGGVHPDAIAEQAGFETGADMLEALIAMEAAHRTAREEGDQRTMRNRIIEEELDEIMQERYGNPLTDGSIEREAIAAVHNELQGEVIASEVRVLARQSGNRPTPYSIAKAWARSKIRSGLVRNEALPNSIQRYAHAARKAARAAETAYLSQDIDGAFRAKHAQMLNNALLSEAKKAHEDVQAARARMDKIASKARIKSVDQDYLEQAHALLEAVDLKRRTLKSVDRQGKWEAWANARAAEGFDIVMPASFEATIGTNNWTRLSVENLLGLDEAVKQIIHLGRLKQTLRDGQELREFEALQTEAVQSAAKLPQKKPSDLMEPSTWDAIKSKIASADAALLKMETVFDWLDGGNPNGVFNRIVFRPIAEAQEAERVRLANMYAKLNEALAAVPKKTLRRWNDKVRAPELLNRETGNPFVFTRDQLVSMALNIGNQGNLDKLTGGYGWSEQGVRAVLDRELTQEEWTYVQAVWDHVNSLWPDIAALEKRLNGVAPEKIEAIPVPTKFGIMQGGYFPVVYDPRRNFESESFSAKADSLFEGIYTRATTPKGFTKERTNVERPIHLSLGVINRHVGEVIHDLTHREAIMQADKFLQSRPIMKAVDDSLGREVRQQFRPWLQRIANEWAYDRAGQAGVEGFIKKARLNTTIVGMGYRFTTIMLQVAGYSNSIERVGARWVVPRLKDAANPAAYSFVLGKSLEVRGRMETLDRDIRDNVRKAAGRADLSAVKKFAFHGIGYMDRVVVIPTWLGAYDKALAEGMSDADAIYAADKAVRQSQGAGAAKDLAAIQTGRGSFGEAGKLLTFFYTFMSSQYQRTRTLGRDARSASVKDIPGLLARTWWLLILPPLLSNLLAGRGPDDEDDESWAEWAASSILFNLFGPLPIAREAAPVIYAKATDGPTFGYRFTPLQGAIESVVNVAGDLGNIAEGEDTKRATRNAIETVGYFTGLTTGQMAVSTQFMVDVSYGEQDPESIGDWYEGLTKGKVSE